MSNEGDLPAAEVLARRLQHTARLAAVGKLASSAAHELNQPLNVMRMAAFNIKRAIDKGNFDPESAMAKLERIDLQINRAAQLVGGMKSFSPTSSATTAQVDVGEAVVTALALMAKQFTAADVELRHDACDTAISIEAPPSALQELVTNLVDNALEAYGSAPASNPLLSEEETPPRALLVKEALVGDAWQLVIEDSAGGIPEALRPHIFEPFFTGHEDDSHAGLGLTVSRELVTRLGGTLDVEHIDSGTRVCIELPVARGIDSGD